MLQPDSRVLGSGRPTGFTLLEMVVVIAVISTLALLVGPSVFRNVGDANVAAARTQIELIGVALDSHRLDTGRYPSTEEGLDALRSAPPSGPTGWRGPYLRRPVPPDPWGKAWVYESPGTYNRGAYDLYSMGRDGMPGGAGEDADITSWGEPLESDGVSDP